MVMAQWDLEKVSSEKVAEEELEMARILERALKRFGRKMQETAESV